MTGNYLLEEFNMPLISTTPMGVVDTALFIRQVASVLNSISRDLVSFESKEAHQSVNHSSTELIDVPKLEHSSSNQNGVGPNGFPEQSSG